MKAVGFVLVLTALLAGYLLLTGQVLLYYVATGSMEPSVPRGSLVLAVPDGEVSVGDLVVYRLDRYILLHRVVEVGPDGITVTADASPDYSEIVARERIVGRVILAVPLLGFLAMFPALAVLSALALSIGLGGRGGLGFWWAAASVLVMAMAGDGGITAFLGRMPAVGLAAATTCVARVAEVRGSKSRHWVELAYACVFLTCLLSLTPTGIRRLMGT